MILVRVGDMVSPVRRGGLRRLIERHADAHSAAVHVCNAVTQERGVTATTRVTAGGHMTFRSR
jgi:sulfur relay (sulfurtransferase) complex TusBCD TusD component (DsrE family)